MADEMTPGEVKAPTTPEQARSIERQNQVLAAALRLLLAGGSAAVTHRRVAEESASSPGAVRYYFHTREDLLAACLDQLETGRVADANTVLAHLDNADRAPEQTARRAFEIYFGTDLVDETVSGLTWTFVDCGRESPRLAQILKSQREAAQLQLEQLLAHCGYPHVDPRLVTAILDGSILSSTIEGSSQAADAAVAALVSALRLSSHE